MVRESVPTAEADVHGGNAQVIEEGGVIGAGAERADAQIGAADQLLALLRGGSGGRLGDAAELQTLPDGEFRLGVLDIAGHAIH